VNQTLALDGLLISTADAPVSDAAVQLPQRWMVWELPFKSSHCCQSKGPFQQTTVLKTNENDGVNLFAQDNMGRNEICQE